MDYYSVYLAQLYGRGLYSSGTYSCTAEQQAQGVCPVTVTSGGLTNTGIAVVGFVTIACVIIFLSLVVRVWRRKKTTPQGAVPLPPDNSSESRR